MAHPFLAVKVYRIVKPRAHSKEAAPQPNQTPTACGSVVIPASSRPLVFECPPSPRLANLTVALSAVPRQKSLPQDRKWPGRGLAGCLASGCSQPVILPLRTVAYREMPHPRIRFSLSDISFSVKLVYDESFW